MRKAYTMTEFITTTDGRQFVIDAKGVAHPVAKNSTVSAAVVPPSGPRSQRDASVDELQKLAAFYG